jgi:hypothetical protein
MMKKMEIMLVILCIVFILGCKKTTWQGVYYPNGCLTCSNDYVYSPVFYEFKNCKKWVFSKQSNSNDKFSCAKNCKWSSEYGMQDCKEVVRNWKPLPISKTFEDYNE